MFKSLLKILEYVSSLLSPTLVGLLLGVLTISEGPVWLITVLLILSIASMAIATGLYRSLLAIPLFRKRVLPMACLEGKFLAAEVHSSKVPVPDKKRKASILGRFRSLQASMRAYFGLASKSSQVQRSEGPKYLVLEIFYSRVHRKHSFWAGVFRVVDGKETLVERFQATGLQMGSANRIDSACERKEIKTGVSTNETAEITFDVTATSAFEHASGRFGDLHVRLERVPDPKQGLLQRLRSWLTQRKSSR